jgi:transposase
VTVAGLDPARLVFLDESGINTKLTRLYGRARPNQRAFGSVPFGHYERLTVIGALAQNGLLAVMTIAAATTTVIFLAFLRQVLILALRAGQPGATVIMDNLSAHKSDAVATVLEDAGFKLLYLPRSSPDLSPIEPCWSKVKTLLRGLLSPPCSKDGGHDKRRSGIRLGTGLGRLGGADCAALSQG